MENTLGQLAERVKGIALASEKPVWHTKSPLPHG
jgi:hypothetical protein